jgi:hypothetical protein
VRNWWQVHSGVAFAFNPQLSPRVYVMRNRYSRSSKGVIADIENKAPLSFRSPDQVFRFKLLSAPAGDEEMEQSCQAAIKLRDDVFWWSFCEESHKD